MQYLKRCIWILAIICSCKQPEHQKSASKPATSATQYGCCVPEVSDRAWYTAGQNAPIFSGLDGIDFPASTKNPKAQLYFNQGLMLSFAFNHAEAGRSFFEATKLDSTFAMAWWGLAYVLGPNYNAGMEKDNFQRAYDAVQKAASLAATCTQKEQDLIDALKRRYSNDTSQPRTILDSTYAAAMRTVHKKYPEDANVSALFVESLMDLHPWNLFKKDGGIQPWTPEILWVLEKCLQKAPLHAGAHHFYIHATEMSLHAEKALKSADLLLNLVPGAGHLVHMPSHTYIRIGKYHEGVVANQKAVLVDSLYVAACHAQGAYPLGYYPHNFHFMAACATLSGESKIALIGAQETSHHSHKNLLRDPAWATLQHYYAIPWFVQVKLGLWNEIRHSTQPEKDLLYPTVIYHYAQGMAMLAQNNIKQAYRHLNEMNRIMKDSTLKNLTIWGINNVLDICLIASKTLQGEILALEKKFPSAIALLQQAVAQEDALNYNEPPDWFFSTRHHLGAVLIDAGKIQESIKIYEEDLKTYRENGWALKGLMNAYEILGEKTKFNETKSRFEKAWKHADISIRSSRIL